MLAGTLYFRARSSETWLRRMVAKKSAVGTKMLKCSFGCGVPSGRSKASKPGPSIERSAEAAEAEWELVSIRDYVERMLEMLLDYHERNPLFVRLWFGGRVSPALTASPRPETWLSPNVPRSASWRPGCPRRT